jgi:hypothetical protein
MLAIELASSVLDAPPMATCGQRIGSVFLSISGEDTCLCDSELRSHRSYRRGQYAETIALNWATRFYGAQDLNIDGVELRTEPSRFWLLRLAANIGTAHLMLYVVLLPDGSIVEPSVRDWSEEPFFANRMKHDAVIINPNYELAGVLDFLASTGSNLRVSPTERAERVRRSLDQHIVGK